MIESILLDDFDIVMFLESYGYKLSRIGGRTQYVTTCVYCGKPEHMGVNPKKKKFGCYKCHTGGSFTKLIGKILGKKYYEVLEFLKAGVDPRKYSSTYIEQTLSIIHDHKDFEDRIKPIKLPDRFISLQDKRIPYCDKRGIQQDQINYYKMGVCFEGKYQNRLIVCDVNEDQTPIYWIARDITGAVKKKDKVWNPPAIKDTVGSADLLFNYNLAKNYKTAILTEGVFDALWVGNNGIASYGVGLKANHLYWIIKGGFSEVVLLYDADVKDDVLDHAACLLGTFVQVRICKLPEGDPDEYDKHILFKYIKQAPKFEHKFKLEKLILK